MDHVTSVKEQSIFESFPAYLTYKEACAVRQPIHAADRIRDRDASRVDSGTRRPMSRRAFAAHWDAWVQGAHTFSRKGV